MLNWGGAGIVVLEECVGRLGVEVCAGCVAVVVAKEGAVFLFCLSDVRFALSMSFLCGQIPATAT